MKNHDFSRRADRTERMDDPDAPLEQLEKTLQQFAVLNRLVSRYRSLIRRVLLKPMRAERNRPYHLIDLGAGGGDIAVWCLRAAARYGVDLRVTALDPDPRCVAFMEKQWKGRSGLSIVQGDAATLANLSPVDAIFGHHVLHHLSDQDIGALLRTCREVCAGPVLFSDLRRSRLAYSLFPLLAAPLFQNSFIVEDGLCSIQRGFQPGELTQAARGAGVSGLIHESTRIPARIQIFLPPRP